MLLAKRFSALLLLLLLLGCGFGGVKQPGEAVAECVPRQLASLARRVEPMGKQEPPSPGD